MKLVPEDINEAIKHLTPKYSEKEFKEYLDKSLKDVLSKESNMEKVKTLFDKFTENLPPHTTRGNGENSIMHHIVDKMDSKELDSILKEIWKEQIITYEKYGDWGEGYFDPHDIHKVWNKLHGYNF
jgi:hypothetical protein